MLERLGALVKPLARAALLGLLVACSAPPESPPSHPRALSVPSSEPSATIAPPPLPALAPLPASPPRTASSAPAAPAAPGPTLAATFHREVAEPVTAIALEAPPHAAALGVDRVFLHDARGWRSEPLPKAVRPGPSFDLSLFYGRDHRVRLVGTHDGGAGPEGVYWRWLPAGFRQDKGEIGRLGAPRGGLVAVLGTADPEIVCRPGEVCLVKRKSGWTTVQAPADIRRVVLGGGVGWAVAGQALLRLGDDGWKPAAAPGSWQSADALFATADRAWIVETHPGRIHAFDGASWQVTTAPLARPRALWGATGEVLWLAADEGLACFDGTTWRRILDAPAPLVSVLGRSVEDVWVGGAGGLFRIALAR